ncbi:cytochrome c [Agrobacterium tumefaciens]|nr:cytochrome c [Agrobacterium tumefaciens]NSZ09322.1 cytochrome c [Agrobacterium tumefaciens]NTC20072.1 cytochrome c [Agrobacterium tumefaciens]NTE53574.1 cytochrome c [Agrobacterium tumefaciens]NTE73270.1 cytochrome c [Agrobacterium tumefaciens]
MKSMADSARIIGELFGGRRPYTQTELGEAAENIRAHAGRRLVESFGGGQQSDSKAYMEVISSSAEEFAKLAHDLEVYAVALTSAADRNPKELGPDTRMGGTLLGSPFGRKADADRDAASIPAEHAYHLMLQTCTSCHAKFREP